MISRSPIKYHRDLKGHNPKGIGRGHKIEDGEKAERRDQGSDSY